MKIKESELRKVLEEMRDRALPVHGTRDVDVDHGYGLAIDELYEWLDNLKVNQ